MSKKPHKKLRKRLLKAAQTGDIDVVNEVIRKGVTIENNLPFMYACRNNRLSIVKLLVENGLTTGEPPPLSSVCQFGHYEVAEYLIELGADVADLDNAPLRRATEAGNTDVVRLLIRHGADATAENNFALKRMRKNIHGLHHEPELVKVLISHGADATLLSAEQEEYVYGKPQEATNYLKDDDTDLWCQAVVSYVAKASRESITSMVSEASERLRPFYLKAMASGL